MSSINDIPISDAPQVLEREGNRASIEIAGLYPGYGVTLGNALRRVLLSSLPGAAVTTVTFEGVPHEFTTIPGIKETALDLILNMKQLRVKLFSDEPQRVTLVAKGEGTVTAADLEVPAQVSLISTDLILATLTSKKAELRLELMIERGIGYQPAEEQKKQKKEKMPIGSIAVDAIFTPVQEVNFTVENMRVGDRTDYNRLVLDIETDGTIEPEEALARAATILVNQFDAAIPEGFAQAVKVSGGAETLLAEPLAILGISSSIMTKLEDDDIRTVGDLARRTAGEVAAVKGLGGKAVVDVVAALKKVDLTLVEDVSEESNESDKPDKDESDEEKSA